LGPALAAGAGTGVNRHGGIHQSRQDDVGTHPEFGVLDRDLLGERHHPGLGRLVATLGYCSHAATDEIMMIEPARWVRITGTTCLQAMIAPRRLIAAIRSNAASVIWSSGASPPAMLTPTL